MLKKCLVLLPLVILGCSQGGDNRLREKVQIETETQAKSNLETQNKRTLEMEADLSKRQNVYQAMKGSFSGDLRIQSDGYLVTAEFVPTVIPFDSKSRVRTPEEVTEDIQKLAFDLKVVVRDATTNALLVNCTSESIKMDLEAGSMSWLSESSSCNNMFSLYLASDDSDPSRRNLDQIRNDSRSLTSNVLRGHSNKVLNITIKMKPSNSSEIYVFNLKKVEL